jgi:hypothetical protein
LRLSASATTLALPGQGHSLWLVLTIAFASYLNPLG